TELGVIQFKDWTDTGEEQATLDQGSKDREAPSAEPARCVSRPSIAWSGYASTPITSISPVSEDVRLVFLGGLGEIGRNCFCLEVEGRILVVDCGLMFPDPDMPGVDLVLPDFTYLRENADRVEGVVLTHAHEDHVGGLSYLLRDVPAPIYGSALCLGFARNRIEEAGLLGRTELVTVRDGDRIDIGPFD